MTAMPLTLSGGKYVILPFAEYRKLCREAGRLEAKPAKAGLSAEDRYWAQAGREAIARFEASGAKPIPFEQTKARMKRGR